MKQIIALLLIGIWGIIAFIFATYALIGFMSWITLDPFDWVSAPKSSYEEPIEFQICRDKGGLPIRSAWDGRVKRCDIMTN